MAVFLDPATDTSIYYEEDLTGDVTIYRDKGRTRVKVPGHLLIMLVSHFVIKQRVDRLELMEPHEIFGIPMKSLPPPLNKPF